MNKLIIYEYNPKMMLEIKSVKDYYKIVNQLLDSILLRNASPFTSPNLENSILSMKIVIQNYLKKNPNL